MFQSTPLADPGQGLDLREGAHGIGLCPRRPGLFQGARGMASAAPHCPPDSHELPGRASRPGPHRSTFKCTGFGANPVQIQVPDQVRDKVQARTPPAPPYRAAPVLRQIVRIVAARGGTAGGLRETADERLLECVGVEMLVRWSTADARFLGLCSGCSGIWASGCSGVRVFGCFGVWAFGCSGVRVFEC